MAIPNQTGESTSPEDKVVGEGNSALASWVAEKVRKAQEHRDNKYSTRWKEYTRLWRGFWAEDDRNADSERSRLITPALQQAVEMTVAEMEEAVFNKPAWFDISDDEGDEDPMDVLMTRDMLLSDFKKDGVEDAICKSFLLGAIYGTGILKINVQKKATKRISKEGEVETDTRVAVVCEAVRPDEFVIDPSALNIDEALFVAHCMYKPLSVVRARQESGVYAKTYVGPWTGEKADTYGTHKWDTAQHTDGGVRIVEYHGLIPKRLLGDTEDKGMVEAIVTIANDGILLKAVANPYLMKDRCFVAYQHDTIPGEFWGRGVCEKGYNPQKALDAEVRARIDALALLSAPMMGADITRLPKNADMRVRPGKTIFTRGRPSEVFEPMSFGNPAILAHTFSQSSDLERMVQVGTGAMDSATPLGSNRRNETSSGMSMMQASFIKRSKRTMQNVERQFMNPLIRKAVWRYVQFAPNRYPQDVELRVNATMGIMAKEVENGQLTQLLGYVPPESPAHSIILRAVFDNTASASKKELSAALQQMMAPPSPEQQQMQQAQQQMQMQAAQLELQKLDLENKKLQAQIEEIKASALHTTVKADLEDDKVELLAAQTSVSAEKARITDRQTSVAEQRNQIEMLKVHREGKRSRE